MNCLVLEHQDEILIIDCGVLFSDLEHFGVELVIPDFSYLLERKHKIKAFVLTHGHEDHIGAVPFAIKAGIRVPIYCSPFTSLLLTERLTEQGLIDSTEIRVFKPGSAFEFDHFKVQTESVNHSIVDACALLIDTPAGTIVHTGDFKIDPTPFYGSRLDERVFKAAGERGVRLLLSDSTNIERCEHTISENVIYQKFEQLFKSAEGMVVIATFASNVARMGQVLEIAQKLGKKVALAGRSMEQNVRLAQSQGLVKDANSVVIEHSQISKHPRNNLIVLSSGSQAELGSALQRVSMGEHRDITIQKGDLVLMSSRYIPGNEKAIGRMINELFKQGAEVLYESVHEIHTSGHAGRPELTQMLEWTKPRSFTPIHGEYRHLVHHAKLGTELGTEAVIATNGDILDLTKNTYKKVGKLEDTRTWVESRQGDEISREVLKERRQMGGTGVVFALLARDEDTGKIIGGPDVIAKGLISDSLEGWLIDEAKEVVRKTVRENAKNNQGGGPAYDLQEEIRIQLRRFFNQNLGKKPVVLPIVLDL
jgi:ribonuclease J